MQVIYIKKVDEEIVTKELVYEGNGGVEFKDGYDGSFVVVKYEDEEKVLKLDGYHEILIR